MCRQEIRWAEQYKKPIVALVRINDKAQMGKFIQTPYFLPKFGKAPS